MNIVRLGVNTRIRSALIIFSICTSGVSAGYAQEKALKLFEAVPETAGPSAAAVPKLVRGAVRQRLVALRLDALEKGVAPRGLDRAADRLARAPRNAPPLSLELFPGQSVTFRKQDLQEAVGGGFVWSGNTATSNGAATLVVRDGRVTGQVEVGGQIFKIEPESAPGRGNVHRVIELKPQLLPKDGPHLEPPKSAARTGSDPLPAIGNLEPSSSGTTSPTLSGSEPTISNTTIAVTTIDLMVAYTSAAQLSSSDIQADINLAVSLANRAFANSAINLRLRLRGTILVAGYNEAAYDYSATLANLTDINAYGSTLTGRASFAPTRRYRNQIGADLVALARSGGRYCGQGWVIPAPSASTAGYGYSQLSIDCVPAYVLAHELGHNMGLNHDRHVEPAAPVTQYNFGFVSIPGRARDIMSYSNLCTNRNVVCTLTNLFSNPRKLVNGRPFGIAAGKTGAADASRRLNETRRGVSAYRATVAPLTN